MPNKRCENKRMLGAWIDEDLKKELSDIAKSEGKSMSEVVAEILEQQIGEHKKCRKNS